MDPLSLLLSPTPLDTTTATTGTTAASLRLLDSLIDPLSLAARPSTRPQYVAECTEQPQHTHKIDRKLAVRACRVLRLQIKAFEDAFAETCKRRPRGSDRRPLASTYRQYRDWKRCIRHDAAAAIHQADAERTALEWADLNPDRQVTILRPTAGASPNASGLIGEALLAAAPIRTRRDDPPQQFVHLDDLATAVATVVQLDDSGVFNVAPDGWLTAREVKDLVGARPTIRLPIPLPGRLDRYVARLSLIHI